MTTQNEQQEGVYIVGGATSGFGGAVARKLVERGARIMAVARTEENLRALQQSYPEQVEYVAGDLTDPAIHDQIITKE